MSECTKHVGRWYGGPDWWCDCGTQFCGYCGGELVAKPPADDEDGPELVVITREEYDRLTAAAVAS